MSNATVTVQGKIAEPTEGDAALASRLQEEELNRGAVSQSSVPVAVVGRPYQPYYQRYEYNDNDEPITGNSNCELTDRELVVLEVFSLGRGIVCLAVLDLILLLFLSVLDIYYLLLFWGPICGLIGKRYFSFVATCNSN